MNLPTPSEPDRIVNELKIATGWQRISYVKGSYVIGFDIQNMQTIKGLIRGQDCFALGFSSFDNLPLSFYVTVNGSNGNICTHQYWTVNGRMHRVGKPAYVAYEEEQDRIIRRWHWNGLLHRTDGPAKEMIKGFSISELGLDWQDYQKETWDLMTLEWWKEGFQCKFPDPQEASIDHGWRTRHRETNKIESPRADLGAWGADLVNISWDAPYKEKLTDMFVPRNLEMTDVLERYHDGVFKDRTCTRSDFEWLRHGKVITSQLTKFNEAIKTGLISDLGLWSGPFYPTSEIEFLLLAEYERVGKDAE